MRLLCAVHLIANVLMLFAVFSDARQQSCTAIKTLETKVDNLIALVKDALPQKPSGTFSMILGYGI